MKKGLFIVGKDVDAHLASHINSNKTLGMSIDLVVLKHRDLLEFKAKFPNITNIHSLPEFLMSQSAAYNDVADEKIFDELHELEQKYRLRTSNRYLHYDFFRSRAKEWTLRKNALDILLYLRFFEKVQIGTYDFVYGELSRSYYLIAYDLTQYYNKEFLSPANLGLFKGIGFVDDKFQIRKLQQRKEELKSNEELYELRRTQAIALIEEFRNRPRYQHTFLSNDRLELGRVIKNTFRKAENLQLEVKSRNIDRNYRVDYLHTSPFTRVLKRNVVSKLSGIAYKHLYFSSRHQFSPRNIYFPLHVHPETTTSLWSEFWVDHTSQQSSSVEFISKIIPTGYKLIVKEHPAMIGTRPTKHYADFRTWYNVDFVGPSVSQFEIIQKSNIILTLCGTVGLEALILNKPVITLSNTYYSYFHNIQCVKSVEDLEKSIPETIANFQPNNDRLIEDMTVLFHSVHHGVLNFIIDDNPLVISDENLNAFALGLKYELDL